MADKDPGTGVRHSPFLRDKGRRRRDCTEMGGGGRHKGKGRRVGKDEGICMYVKSEGHYLPYLAQNGT